MNKLIPGLLWLPILLGGLLWCWAADGAPVTGVGTSKNPNMENDFRMTLKLSMKLLHDSRGLTNAYLAQKLPGSHLDFTGSDPTFPTLSISFSSWLKLKTGDRLRLLSEALHIYPIYLEQLEKWEKKEEEGEAPNLKETVRKVRFDLRDLLHHVEGQMKSFGIVPPRPLKQHNVPTNGSDWHSRVQMYQALRSLVTTLYRAVREYTALQRFHE